MVQCGVYNQSDILITCKHLIIRHDDSGSAPLVANASHLFLLLLLKLVFFYCDRRKRRNLFTLVSSSTTESVSSSLCYLVDCSTNL
uniref:Uncharacterized protein n=1 Tax=Seriola dumerili TaxID=41447 RepID=A0A3B4TE39_SERDU